MFYLFFIYCLNEYIIDALCCYYNNTNVNSSSGENDVLILMATPVSYTHLDVYKRQLTHSLVHENIIVPTNQGVNSYGEIH